MKNAVATFAFLSLLIPTTALVFVVTSSSCQPVQIEDDDDDGGEGEGEGDAGEGEGEGEGEAPGGPCDNFLGVDDGCDCGCGAGITDPDCPDGNVTSCGFNNCDDGQVPTEGDPTQCAANVCGDGYVLGFEEVCDDGGGTGCSDDCTAVDAGFVCGGNASGCRPLVCADGIIEGSENCDDGNTTPGDGCDAACVEEEGFNCPDVGAPCVAVPAGWTCDSNFFADGGTCDCGCGVADAAADCDDATRDSCEFNNCPVDQVPTAANPAACAPNVCADGFLAGGENCDDGNTTAGDGCDAACAEEEGFACVVIGDPCIAIPAAWTCQPGFFGGGDFDGCDCGCGAEDPDCAAFSTGNGCIEPGCEVDACEFCHNGDATEICGGGGEGEGEGEGE